LPALTKSPPGETQAGFSISAARVTFLGVLSPALRIHDIYDQNEFLATLNKLNITVDPDSSNRILTGTYRLAVTYRLTSYDASYLELALRKKLPLATLDAELMS
jgi:hypothetical protein